jgi:hypothetical protein
MYWLGMVEPDSCGGLYGLRSLLSRIPPLWSRVCSVRRVWINCRWPNLKSINHSRIRRDCETFYERFRSLVVLTEGSDLRRWSFEPGDVEKRT